jgi:hypothetical protein
MNATLNERSENNLSIRIVASYCLACELKSHHASHVRYARGVYPPTATNVGLLLRLLPVRIRDVGWVGIGSIIVLIERRVTKAAAG